MKKRHAAKRVFMIIAMVFLSSTVSSSSLAEPADAASAPSNAVSGRGLKTSDDMNGIVIQEVAVESALKATLAEKEKLRKEKEDAEGRLDKLNGQISLYAEKIRSLTARTAELEKEMLSKDETTDKVRMNSEIKLALMKKEKEDLDGKVAELEKEREDSKYYILWKESSIKLATSEAALKKFTRENAFLKEESGKSHYNLGNILFRQGDYKRALYEYETALKTIPNDSDVLYNLALIYDYHLPDPQKAEDYYIRYLRANPAAEDALKIKEKVMEKKFETKMRGDTAAKGRKLL